MKSVTISRTSVLVALMLLTVAAYVQSFSHEFVLDDHDLLERVVPTLHTPLDAWKTGNAFQSYYRPVFLTSLDVDNLLFGDTAAGYHAMNLALHLLAVWFAFLFAERLFGDWKAAAAVAVLFAVQPTHTENISWVSGRTDILAAIFSFLALIAFHDLLAHRRTRDVWLAALFFFLAVGAKEVAVVVPALCLVLALFHPPPAAAPAARPGKAARGRTSKAQARSSNAPIVQLFGLFAAGIVLVLILRSAVSKTVIEENVFLTVGAQALNAARCFAMYVWHAIAGGGYEYIILGWRVNATEFNLALPTETSTWVAVGATILAYAGALIWAIRARRTVAAFGLIGFVLMLVPALGFVPILSIFSVRFLYLPSFFLALAVVDAARAALARMPRPVWRRVAAGALVGVSLWWGAATYVQDGHWDDDLTLMQSIKTPRVEDSPVYWFCLGNGYRYRGNYIDGSTCFGRAVIRYPAYYDAYVNLAGCLVVLGQTHPEYNAQAADVYTHAITQFPRSAPLYAMSGDLYLRMGDTARARQTYATGFGVQPTPELRQRLETLTGHRLP